MTYVPGIVSKGGWKEGRDGEHTCPEIPVIFFSVNDRFYHFSQYKGIGNFEKGVQNSEEKDLKHIEFKQRNGNFYYFVCGKSFWFW